MLGELLKEQSDLSPYSLTTRRDVPLLSKTAFALDWIVTMTHENAIETPRPRKEKMALDEMKKMDVEPPAAKPLLALE